MHCGHAYARRSRALNRGSVRPAPPLRVLDLAPEEKLLLAAARTEIDPLAGRRAAALVAAGLDWNYVLEASIRHAIAPLVRYGLDRIEELQPLELAPRWALDAFSALRRGSASRNARLFEALTQIVGAMRDEGAEPVGLKDVQLAMEIYPEPGLRPMGDVDLLVRRDDWDAAARALASLGFFPRPSADVPYTRRYMTGQHFRRAADEIWIDLQWNVLQREWDLFGEGTFTYDGLEMWNRAMPMRVGSVDVRVPNLEDMLFHLCLHLEGHVYGELILFCDIAELLRRSGDRIDWEEFLAVTRRYRAEASVYYVLLLTRQLLGVGPPEHVLEGLRSRNFPGGLFIPVFGNLTPLHVSLDEIRRVASPPQGLLDEFELVARRQAARAMRLNSELNVLADTFLDAGGRLIVWDGTPPPRVFPDDSLPPFGTLEAFILVEDAPLFRIALADNGFDADRKECAISSLDPVLSGSETTLVVELEMSKVLSVALAEQGETLSNARRGLRSLRSRTFPGGRDDTRASTRLLAHALSPDELAVAVAVRVGRAEEDRLFRLVSLLELLTRLPGALDAARIAELAHANNVAREVALGLRAVTAVLDRNDPEIEDAIARLPDVQPRVLEWARYGPSSLTRFPLLRGAYYYVFSLLSLRGLRPRLAFLLHSIVGGKGVRPVFWGILFNLARAAGPHGPRRSTRELAYWIDPATLARLPTSGGGPVSESNAQARQS